MKYRKKPVVIDAVKTPLTMDDAYGLGMVAGFFLAHDFDRFAMTEDGGWIIDTLEGAMKATPGDWIIRGVNGEFYPCKDEIFLKTYEPV